MEICGFLSYNCIIGIICQNNIREEMCMDIDREKLKQLEKSRTKKKAFSDSLVLSSFLAIIHTLYSNDVNNAECYHILKLFKEKVLGDVVI